MTVPHYDVIKWKHFLRYCPFVQGILRSSLNYVTEAEQHMYAFVSCAIIGSDNGFSPVRWKGIVWTNAGLLSIDHLATKFNEISIEIQWFSFKEM